MDKFWELMRESVIIQGAMTVATWGAVIYLAIAGRPIPEVLVTGAVAILGFWFGSKSQAVVSRSSSSGG